MLAFDPRPGALARDERVANWRGGGPTGTVGVAFAPALVVIAAQLAGALSWIALSAEDAPDFLAAAPVARSAIERGKIASIGQPWDRPPRRPELVRGQSLSSIIRRRRAGAPLPRLKQADHGDSV